MKEAIDGERNHIEDDMPAEIDFSKAARGKYFAGVSQGATMVLLEPEVAGVFLDSETVSAALRMVLRAGADAGSETFQVARKSN